MSEALANQTAGAAIRHDRGAVAALRMVDCLSLAAAPTFALMALLTGAFGGGRVDLLCSAAQGASPLNGMVPMYLLMSVLHLAPWLKRFANRTERRHNWSLFRSN